MHSRFWPLFGWEAMRWRYIPMHAVAAALVIASVWVSTR